MRPRPSGCVIFEDTAATTASSDQSDGMTARPHPNRKNHHVSTLRYEIFTRGDDLLERPIASGTIATSGTMSIKIDIPRFPNGVAVAGVYDDVVGLFQNLGGTGVYVHILGREDSAPNGDGNHAEVDAQPRLFIKPDDEALITLPPGGKFAAVDAAAFS